MGGFSDALDQSVPRAVVGVMLVTSLGRIVSEIDVAKAPLSSAAFLVCVDDGSLAGGGSFYRAVRRKDNGDGDPQIDVVQGGLGSGAARGQRVGHESTLLTGLRHVDGAIFLARAAIGTATGTEFFVCVGEQPDLDAGGLRNRDGHGFAAFGRVIAGMDTIRRIHRSTCGASVADPYLRGQMLAPAIRIVVAARLSLDQNGWTGRMENE